jgi:hypothetical protein
MVIDMFSFYFIIFLPVLRLTYIIFLFEGSLFEQFQTNINFIILKTVSVDKFPISIRRNYSNNPYFYHAENLRLSK